jgi:8-oxo-dGTP pyrophosphatase MutT (NUDIX family)
MSRPDIAAVMLYRRAGALLDTEIVMVKEFRSPVSNESGFVWELPSGSDRKTQAWDEVARTEVLEETGLNLEGGRFRRYDARQLAATFSAHKATLFYCELTEEEMAGIRETEGQMRGNNVTDSEQTYVYVRSLRLLLGNQDSDLHVDWSTLGMIFSVLQAR